LHVSEAFAEPIEVIFISAAHEHLRRSFVAGPDIGSDGLNTRNLLRKPRLRGEQQFPAVTFA
jgi:hypothetical protein